MSTIDYIIIALYLVAMIAIGFIAKGKIETMDDFILGGKRFNVIALSGTITATMIGSGMSIGAVGNAYSNGAAGTVSWMYAGFACGLFFFAAISAKTRDTGARTMAEVIFFKFGRTSRLIASLIIIGYAVSIVAINIAGLRTVILGVFGDKLTLSVPMITAIAACIAILYTSVGGFFAVVWTDVVQLGFMIIGIIILGPIIGLTQSGGFGPVIESFEAAGGSFTNPFIHGISSTSVGFFLAYFLTVPGDPTMPQRALAARSGKTAAIAFSIAGVVGIFMGLSLIIIGGTTAVIMPDLPNPESALILLITTHYPAIIRGLVIAAILAAIMSSFDSFLILATTHIVYDLGSYMNKDLNEKTASKVLPYATVVIGVLGLTIALFIQSLFQYLYMVFSIVGSALVPAFLVSLLWSDKSNKIAVNASMIVGTFVPAVLYLTVGYDVFLGDPVFLGILSSTATLVLLSLVLPKEKALVQAK